MKVAQAATVWRGTSLAQKLRGYQRMNIRSCAILVAVCHPWNRAAMPPLSLITSGRINRIDG